MSNRNILTCRLAVSIILAIFTLTSAIASDAATGRLGETVSANFREVDLEAALDFLAENAGINVVLSPKAQELGRPVTLRLVDVPLIRALDYLVKGQGMVYRFDEDGSVFVATLDEMESEPLQTKVFSLNFGPGLFADFEPLTELKQSVALQTTGIRKLTTVKDILEEVIPQTANSSILIDERSGSLIVTNVPYYLNQAQELISHLDIVPVPVRIEARFIELTVEDANEWGFDSFLTGNASLTKKGAGDGTRGAGIQISADGTDIARGTQIDFSNFTNQTAGNGLNLTLQGVLSGTQYQAVLHALIENQRTKTLSAPQVITLNNQTAAIKIVTEFVYASRYEPSVVREDLNSDGDYLDVEDGVSETRFVNVPQDFVTKDLGIILNVTPSVGQDMKTITLALKPEVSEEKTEDTFSGEVSLPRFTTRNLETSVVIEDGETVVLGGLMRDTTTKTVTKVPFFSNLPMVGKLFQKIDDSSERSNLLIFVSAKILKSQNSQQLAKSPE